MNNQPQKYSFLSRLLVALVIPVLLGACAHPITISPLKTPERNSVSVSQKKAAYVMTEADRGKQIISNGGGGDKVSSYPYRDLEKAIRDALLSEYSDVFVIQSASDNSAIQGNGVSFIFTPAISVTSNSDSLFTWPPTQFNIDLSCNVTDAAGKTITQIRAIGKGAAEYSEFKSDFGLAGRRAASDLSEKLKQEIKNNPHLH